MKPKKINKPVIWQPQPGPQTQFCQSSIFEVLYGGSAGGGKTDALLVNGLRQINHPEYRAIIFRRTTKQLTRLVDRSMQLFRKAFPLAKWNDTKLTWTFPSGAKYALSHMEREKDKFNHDGQEYQYIGFDELTHFTESQYLYLLSRCRTSNSDINCYIRASAMPMGIGITWVKQRFIDPGVSTITDPETGLTRQFIPATLDDNQVLMQSDPQYESRLKLMGPKMFRALRSGDWDIIEGSVFEELDRDIHMIQPHDPPEGVYCWRAIDWGYAKPFSIGWYYENFDGQIIRFREWYGWNGQADTGLRMGAAEVAKEIYKYESDLNVSHGVADPSIWSKIDDAPSIAETMRYNDILWEPANNDRIQGWMELHNRLRTDQTGRPMFMVTSNCKHFWRTIPMLQPDPRKPEDVDTKMEDHVGDEVRYSLMDRPLIYLGSSEIYMGDDTVMSHMN